MQAFKQARHEGIRFVLFIPSTLYILFANVYFSFNFTCFAKIETRALQREAIL
jgi:hypothetical protein